MKNLSISLKDLAVESGIEGRQGPVGVSSWDLFDQEQITDGMLSNGMAGAWISANAESFSTGCTVDSNIADTTFKLPENTMVNDDVNLSEALAAIDVTADEHTRQILELRTQLNNFVAAHMAVPDDMLSSDTVFKI